MARRNTGARLPDGTFVTDFSSVEKVMETLKTPAAVSKEYSRQRSIIRKRVERLGAAGEVYNRLYETFGNVAESMPDARSLTTEQQAKLLGAMSRAIAGGYQNTLREIRKSRREVLGAVRAQAEKAKDKELADFLSKEPTPAQMSRIYAVADMVRKTIGAKTVGSGELFEKITEMVMVSTSKESLLTMAAQIIANSGMATVENLSNLKARFTKRGTERVAWKKAHKKRGK